MASDVAPLVLRRILVDGALLSVAGSTIIFLSLRVNPRLWLQDFPKDIQDAVAPKTAAERRLSLLFGSPFLAVLVDLVLIDWVVVCGITPAFVVVPGTEGLPGYRNFRHHARGCLVGTAGSAAMAAIVAALESVG